MMVIVFSSVIVREFHVMSAIASPAKDESPLVVYTNAVKAIEVTAQRLETVGRWRTQLAQVLGGVQLCQLSQGGSHDNWRDPVKPRGGVSVEEVGGHLVRKGPNHVREV